MSRIRYIVNENAISFSKLKARREQQRVSAADLASQTGVSRQTIHAVEAGSFVPSTRIALQLARALNCSVEDLFSLDDETEPRGVSAEVLTNDFARSNQGQLVRLVSSDTRQYALPLSDTFNFLPAADGVTGKGGRTDTEVFLSREPRNTRLPTLLIAGCDPALSLLTELAGTHNLAVQPVAASSQQALRWLAQGKVHVAGSHLLDPASGEYNTPAIRRLFPEGGVSVLTFSEWQTGLLTAPGNPKSIRSFADLYSRNVSLVNREKGSGTRAQLDAGLKAAGLTAHKIKGYERVVRGHLAAAFSVANGWADCCLANSAAARCFGLAFHPLRTERFDLIFPQQLLKTNLGEDLAELLNSYGLRCRLQAIAGYETRHTGATVV